MGFITPIFHSVGNLPLLSISLKFLSNEGSKKHRPCLIISFRIESMLLAFFVLSFDICSWISFGAIGFPKISSSDKFSVSSASSHLQNLYFHLFHCCHKVIVGNVVSMLPEI